MPTRFVRYSDDVEVVGPDEDRIAEEIIATMRGESEVLLDRYRHATRPSHGKSHGLLKGELRVLPGLPPKLAQGLFASRTPSPSSPACPRSRATSWPTRSPPSAA